MDIDVSARLPCKSTALLAEGVRFSETIAHLAKSTGIPKGMYRFRSHAEANTHQEDCLVQGITRFAAERS